MEELITLLTTYANDSKTIWQDLNDEQSFGEYVAYSFCIELLNEYKERIINGQ